MQDHQTFRQYIPLFKDLPDRVYFNLDLSHFVIPTQEVEKLRADLEKKLDHYVVTYNKGIFRLDTPINSHICAIVKGAQLDEQSIDLLQSYEKILEPKGITLVVFQRPLEIMPVEKSLLYKKYQDLGLL